MTATVSTPRSDVTGTTNRPSVLPGFGGLIRKEFTEWRRSRRIWIVFLVSALFMTLAALNTWLQSVLPEEALEGAEAPVLDPLMILVQSVSAQIFVVAAIFAVMALVTAERESGTLAWTASKPVSRSGIWLAKFSASSAVLWIAAGIVPIAATVGLVLALYGPVPVLPVVAITIGVGLAIVLYVGVALAAATIVSSQAAVAAIAIGFMFLPQFLGLFLPNPEFLPQSILQWSILVGVGEPAGFITPVAWALTVAGLVALSVRRMEAMEL